LRDEVVGAAVSVMGGEFTGAPFKGSESLREREDGRRAKPAGINGVRVV